MAAVMKAHVQSSPELGDAAEPQHEDNSDHSHSDREDVDGGSDVEEAENEDGGDGGKGDDGNSSLGWAEAMAKILAKKVPDSKATILLQNKELDKLKQKEKQEQLERKKQVDRKRAWEMLCREKPDVVKGRDSERTLQRIATRGVVQLFNAVKKHQKTVDGKVKEVGGSERKRAKILSSVSKKDFIDVLRRTEGGKAVKTEKENAAAAEETPAWSVLREDFMMGASMKDWDQESDGEGAEAETRGGVEDSDSD
ncbi:hypothetical protein LDENG_00164460 [Lucifuga dentata]|nr:hypothetical protein LDENG_00164460 [Lucifuga dentata]